ncbi:MAG: FtsQ-type POTRA domain-containing protein [Oscillospiraceae bacterium]|nr:FtsQ-type POTRA domain-containing protein [Oscillospiraceae bacterium]
MDTNDRNRRRRRTAVPEPKRRKRSDANVVYTEAKPFNRNRFILQLVTVAAVVIALLLGLSIFFKAEKFVVSGCKKYSAYEIRVATGLQEGENLLTINSAKASGRLLKALPYVHKVRVQIKLPDTVLIEVEEVKVIYAIQEKNEDWWLIDCGGKVLEKVSVAETKKYTRLRGVRLDSPVAGEKAVAEEPVPEGTTPDGEPIPVTVYGSERLSALLSVLRSLEKNGVLGNVVSSVDVTNIGAIELWYGDSYEGHEGRYHVWLGDSANMDQKIRIMKQTIADRGENQSGILDIRLNDKTDGAVCMPLDKK